MLGNMSALDHYRSGVPATRPTCRQRSRGSRAAPILVLLTVSMILVPAEASLFIGTIRLPVARLMLLVATPLAIAKYAANSGKPEFRFVWSDLLVPITALWMVASVCMTDGAERGFVGGGSIALDLLGCYFTARVFLRAESDAISLARTIVFSTALGGILAIPDIFSGSYVIHTAVGSLTGYQIENVYDIRNGHFRAAGVLEHPILLGTSCAFGLLLCCQIERGAARLILSFLQLVGLAAAVSSAPLLGCGIGMGCLMYRRLTPSADWRWKALLGLAATCFALVLVFVPDPLGAIIRHATFDPQTGNYRIQEWIYAGQDVMASPWIGIGLTEMWLRPDWMPTSIDSVWLRSAMQFGIPGSILLAACIIGACSRGTDYSRANLSAAGKRLGVCLSIILSLYVVLGFTVHFWGATWMLLGTFMGMRAHLGALATRPAQRRNPETRRPAGPPRPGQQRRQS